MAVVSSTGLLDALRQTQLLRPEQTDTVRHHLQRRYADTRTILREVVQEGWLTVYQMNELLAGNGSELLVGPYHVLDKLGQGGQSIVYKARHTETGGVVALKVIKAGFLTRPEACLQFLQEMEAMAALNHPNIVQFHDADKHAETYYCALEYVEGTDLGKYVRLTGPLPTVEACDYVRQVALGLQHAHERNIIHRDIKPVNLLLPVAPKQQKRPTFGTGSVVKILDWGLASLKRSGARIREAKILNSTKAIIGTADYLSPEQALNPAGVDIRGDIYSLGCTFYYLLTGRPPFHDGTVMQKIMKHQKEEPRPVDSMRPDLPLGLMAILRRLLAKRPEERFQTPGAVAVALSPYCYADRFILPRLNREIRRRLGLEADPLPIKPSSHTGLCDGLSSTFGPHASTGNTTSVNSENGQS